MTERMGEAEFARLIALRRGQVAWFLGAGASASAGVPTAAHMIADFKASLYASAQQLTRREIDTDDPLWLDRINRYFDGANGFPALGDPREYEVAFSAMYQLADDRRRCIADAVERGSPSYGQRVLGALLAAGHTPAVFTTNFDSLIEQSTSSSNDVLAPDDRHPLRVSALTDADIARRVLNQGDWPLLAKLHGDYQSDAIKNTTAELREQDSSLRLTLTESMRRFGLVVAGYSGRDDSVIDALEEVLTSPNPYPNGLFWVVRSSTSLLPRVEDFLAKAVSAGVEVRLVESETFDELLAAVERQVVLPTELRDALESRSSSELVVDVSLPTVEVAKFPVLRFNALPVVAMPSNAISVAVNIDKHELRRLLRENRASVDAVPNGAHIIALGSDRDLRDALRSAANSVVFGTRALDAAASTVEQGLLLNALTRALSRDRPLRYVFDDRGNVLHLRDPSSARDAAYRRQLDAKLAPFRDVYGKDLFGVLPKFGGRKYAEGVRIRLDFRLSQWWLVFEPFTWVERHPERVRPDPVAPWIRERWFQRRNKEWAAMVAAWTDLLVPDPETVVQAWSGEETTKFVLGQKTAWSVPGQEGLA